MYILCRVCGNDTFRITVEMVAECTSCGAKFSLGKPIDKLPKPDGIEPFRFLKDF